MSYRHDQSKKSSTAFDQATTLVAVVELSRARGSTGKPAPQPERLFDRVRLVAAAAGDRWRTAVLTRDSSATATERYTRHGH
jgi:hypothetical protein